MVVAVFFSKISEQKKRLDIFHVFSDELLWKEKWLAWMHAENNDPKHARKWQFISPLSKSQIMRHCARGKKTFGTCCFNFGTVYCYPSTHCKMTEKMTEKHFSPSYAHYTWHTTPKANTVINYNRRKSVQYNTWMCVQGTWTSVPQMKSHKETIICLIIHNITHKIKAYLEEIEAFQTSSKLCPEKRKNLGPFSAWLLNAALQTSLHRKCISVLTKTRLLN